MDQTWIQVLVVLLFCQKFISAENIEEGKETKVSCDLKDGTMMFWFRVLDGSNMEFIVSSSMNGIQKSKHPHFDTLFKQPDSGKSLIVKSFNKTRDSGIYSCASLVSGNRLDFGRVTRLAGVQTKPVTPPPRHTTTQTSTTKSCAVQTPGSSMFCNPLILGSLAGGCGLLLLLLIITILYCNKIRTRRCPHHYKRRPRTDALEKQMMTNRHI